MYYNGWRVWPLATQIYAYLTDRVTCKRSHRSRKENDALQARISTGARRQCFLNIGARELQRSLDDPTA